MEGNASETADRRVPDRAAQRRARTVDELAGLAATMRALATPVECDRDDLLDTAGTGGGRTTFNVSTTAALIAAGSGLRRRQARQPQRDRSQRLGRRARGARRADRPERRRGRALHRPGRVRASCSRRPITRRRATSYPVRRELAVRTIFNFLGPLTNPAGARRQVIGVSDAGFIDVIAGALAAPWDRPGVGSVQRGWP
jgi:anthranilate phosphoribosyltransferase